MMSCRKYASLLLLTVLLSACNEQENPFDPEVVSSDVLAMLSEYASAANSGDLDAALSYYVQDSRFSWAEDGAIRYSSYDDLEVAIRRFADYADFSTEYSDPFVNALTRDHAQLFTSFKTTVGDVDAGGFSFSGVITMSLVRTETGWKIMAGHTSTARERPAF